MAIAGQKGRFCSAGRTEGRAVPLTSQAPRLAAHFSGHGVSSHQLCRDQALAGPRAVSWVHSGWQGPSRVRAHVVGRGAHLLCVLWGESHVPVCAPQQ